jgi:hypothetical protein
VAVKVYVTPLTRADVNVTDVDDAAVASVVATMRPGIAVTVYDRIGAAAAAAAAAADDDADDDDDADASVVVEAATVTTTVSTAVATADVTVGAFGAFTDGVTC